MLVPSIKADSTVIIFGDTVELSGTTREFIQTTISSQQWFPFWGEATITLLIYIFYNRTRGAPI